eukprot:scaffold4328_cov135-Isochrysis_galbana.AAC.17
MYERVSPARQGQGGSDSVGNVGAGWHLHIVASARRGYRRRPGPQVRARSQSEAKGCLCNVIAREESAVCTHSPSVACTQQDSALEEQARVRSAAARCDALGFVRLGWGGTPRDEASALAPRAPSSGACLSARTTPSSIDSRSDDPKRTMF